MMVLLVLVDQLIFQAISRIAASYILMLKTDSSELLISKMMKVNGNKSGSADSDIIRCIGLIKKLAKFKNLKVHNIGCIKESSL